MQVTAAQYIYLDEEVKTSTRLIVLGFAELQRINFTNYSIHVPCLLLSSGFERLMKCMICLKSLDKSKKFPTPKLLQKKLGHDLIKLKKYLLKYCILKTTALKTPATSEDYDLLLSNQELDKLIEIFSNFGRGGRYYNLDVVTQNPRLYPNFQRDWEKIEGYYLKKLNLTLDLTDKEKIDEVFIQIYTEMVIILEKFSRALMRQFVKGDLGEKAPQYSINFTYFLILPDDKLGNTRYSTLDAYK